MSFDRDDELKSIWRYIPEDYEDMTKVEAIEQIAEMAITSEEAEYGNDILGSDRWQVKDGLVRDLNEAHSRGDAEDPGIYLGGLNEDF